MRITITSLLAGLLTVTGLTGCGTPTQIDRIEPRTAPVSFQTYAWGTEVLTGDTGAPAQLVELDTELRGTVSALLQSRGYRQVQSVDSAQMVVEYQIAVVEEEFASEEENESWDAQFDSNAQRGVVELPDRSGAPRVTLSVGIGPHNGMPIWGGSATKLMARPEDKNERQRILNKAVGELLKDLPPAS
ncbi:DUF4136 domain-containing protein [Microbulbifer hydrolyticus]|uniref:DUF4136 domain-containing protein n=1 Tax=Microbulbifer hydrolyticus TaxID=48074 RepID=A0A6P1T909_9GAMM|nr:DUF4136 domain-containing protein [Microbulbifer hydrolyticus]MBB5211116.1 hypothetical protein [Microbulbifer hydrolyticus]QHQ38100.1 DUF4136 domain-containing protein [Microbulbifer hydrolyticus]